MQHSSQNNCNTTTRCMELWDLWDDILPVASLKFQELDILETLSAEVCVFFIHRNICETKLKQESKMLPLIVSELNTLAYFVAKKINETFLILSALSIDLDSVQHSTL